MPPSEKDEGVRVVEASLSLWLTESLSLRESHASRAGSAVGRRADAARLASLETRIASLVESLESLEAGVDNHSNGNPISSRNGRSVSPVSSGERSGGERSPSPSPGGVPEGVTVTDHSNAGRGPPRKFSLRWFKARRHSGRHHPRDHHHRRFPTGQGRDPGMGNFGAELDEDAGGWLIVPPVIASPMDWARHAIERAVAASAAHDVEEALARAVDAARAENSGTRERNLVERRRALLSAEPRESVPVLPYTTHGPFVYGNGGNIGNGGSGNSGHGAAPMPGIVVSASSQDRAAAFEWFDTASREVHKLAADAVAAVAASKGSKDAGDGCAPTQQQASAISTAVWVAARQLAASGRLPSQTNPPDVGKGQGHDGDADCDADDDSGVKRAARAIEPVLLAPCFEALRSRCAQRTADRRLASRSAEWSRQGPWAVAEAMGVPRGVLDAATRGAGGETTPLMSPMPFPETVALVKVLPLVRSPWAITAQLGRIVRSIHDTLGDVGDSDDGGDGDHGFAVGGCNETNNNNNNNNNKTANRATAKALAMCMACTPPPAGIATLVEIAARWTDAGIAEPRDVEIVREAIEIVTHLPRKARGMHMEDEDGSKQRAAGGASGHHSNDGGSMASKRLAWHLNGGDEPFYVLVPEVEYASRWAQLDRHVEVVAVVAVPDHDVFLVADRLFHPRHRFAAAMAPSTAAHPHRKDKGKVSKVSKGKEKADGSVLRDQASARVAVVRCDGDMPAAQRALVDRTFANPEDPRLASIRIVVDARDDRGEPIVATGIAVGAECRLDGSDGIICVPDGDFDAALPTLRLQVTLHRLGCSTSVRTGAVVDPGLGLAFPSVLSPSVSPAEVIAGSSFAQVWGPELPDASQASEPEGPLAILVALQRALVLLMMLPERHAPDDGVFGYMTAEAVRRFATRYRIGSAGSTSSIAKPASSSEEEAATFHSGKTRQLSLIGAATPRLVRTVVGIVTGAAIDLALFESGVPVVTHDRPTDDDETTGGQQTIQGLNDDSNENARQDGGSSSNNKNNNNRRCWVSAGGVLASESSVARLRNALVRFQQRHGLCAEGFMDERTLAVLAEEAAARANAMRGTGAPGTTGAHTAHGAMTLAARDRNALMRALRLRESQIKDVYEAGLKASHALKEKKRAAEEKLRAVEQSLDAVSTGLVEAANKNQSLNEKIAELERQRADAEREAEKARQEAAQSESRVCVVCLDAPVSVVLQPCRHVCMCKRCSLVVRDCPMCRTAIERRITVFIA